MEHNSVSRNLQWNSYGVKHVPSPSLQKEWCNGDHWGWRFEISPLSRSCSEMFLLWSPVALSIKIIQISLLPMPLSNRRGQWGKAGGEQNWCGMPEVADEWRQGVGEPPATPGAEEDRAGEKLWMWEKAALQHSLLLFNIHKRRKSPEIPACAEGTVKRQFSHVLISFLLYNLIF